MDKIKVLHISRSASGGIRRHVVGIAHLGSDRFENFFCTDHSDADISFLKGERKGELKFKELFFLTIPTAPSPKDFFNLFSLARFIRKNRIDILHGHGAKGGLYARLLGFFLRLPAVYTTHGGSLHTMFSPLGNFFYKSIEKCLYYLSDAIVFESEYSLKQYQKRIHKKSSKFVLNYNGILFSDSCPRSECIFPPYLIGAFGQLRHIKGHDLLIRALKNLSSKYDLRLVIHGSGEKKDELLSLAEELGIGERVAILEHTQNIDEEIRKCFAVVQPSRFESFGYVPLEAQAQGVPVIASRVGGLSEVVIHEKSGLLFENESVNELASLIERLIGDELLRKNLIQNAWELGRLKFSEERMVNELCSLYQRLRNHEF